MTYFLQLNSKEDILENVGDNKCSGTHYSDIIFFHTIVVFHNFMVAQEENKSYRFGTTWYNLTVYFSYLFDGIFFMTDGEYDWYQWCFYEIAVVVFLLHNSIQSYPF